MSKPHGRRGPYTTSWDTMYATETDWSTSRTVNDRYKSPISGADVEVDWTTSKGKRVFIGVPHPNFWWLFVVLVIGINAFVFYNDGLHTISIGLTEDTLTVNHGNKIKEVVLFVVSIIVSTIMTLEIRKEWVSTYDKFKKATRKGK